MAIPGVYEWLAGLLAAALITAVGYFLHRLDHDVLHTKLDIRGDINRLENKVDGYATQAGRLHGDSRELFEKMKSMSERVEKLERAVGTGTKR